MTETAKPIKLIGVLTPVIGTLLFIVLYIVATLLYPGGSQADKHAKGFSWINNYWCNLLNENAINGEPNPAKPFALTGMFILCVTLSVFWYHFPRHFNFGKYSSLSIRLSGIAAMAIAMLLFTGVHDAVINIAGFLALIALIGTVAGLYISRWYWLMWFGIFNLILILVNNLFYHTTGLLVYLPVIQKITFVTFLLWFCLIDITIYQQLKVKMLKDKQAED